MITLDHKGNLISVAVLGEFTLADFREFETLAVDKLRNAGLVDVLFDLREMLAATIDVAWEEFKFSRAHAHDFGRIAVITKSDWVAWSAWLSQLFVDAETEVFEDDASARAWLADGNE